MICPYPWRFGNHSGVSVNPGFGETDDKLFSILACLEPIRQTAKAVRITPAVACPGDFRSGTPVLAALVKRRIGDDQTVVVIKIGHIGQNYRHVTAQMPIIAPLCSSKREHPAANQHSNRGAAKDPLTAWSRRLWRQGY